MATTTTTTARDRLMRDLPEQLSTYQIGELLSVSHTTVTRWLERGDLEGWRLPAPSRAYRVGRDGLLRFLHERGLVLPGSGCHQRRHEVLLVGCPALLVCELKALLADDQGHRGWLVAGGAFEAGLLLGRCPHVDAVVLDFSGMGQDGKGQALALVGSVRRDRWLSRRAPSFVAVVSEDEQDVAGLEDTFLSPGMLLQRTFGAPKLADLLRRLEEEGPGLLDVKKLTGKKDERKRA